MVKFHIFHDWSKWEVVPATFILGTLWGKKAGQRIETTAQKRTCKKCGLVELV